MANLQPPDFSRPSAFNKDANFESVRFGEHAPLLEVDLNELQDIQNYKRKELARVILKDGIRDINDISLVAQASNVVKVVIENTYFALEGDLLTVPYLESTVSSGESLYLRVETILITPQSTIRKNGNLQSPDIVPNKIVDDRIGVESARRHQVTYTLTKSNSDPSAQYILIGKNVSGVFTIAVNNYSGIQEEVRESIDMHKVDNRPHQYGNRFAWVYNSLTDSLDLEVIK